MNEIEQKAYNWLISELKYIPTQISFRRRKTPDFITSDGKGFEIKYTMSNVLLIQKSQFKVLKKLDNVLVVVYKNNSQFPVVTFNSDQLVHMKKFGTITVKEVDDQHIIRISKSSMDSLTNIKGFLMMQNGSQLSYDDVLKLCAEYYLSIVTK